jgi:hypothetical protein
MIAVMPEGASCLDIRAGELGALYVDHFVDKSAASSAFGYTCERRLGVGENLDDGLRRMFRVGMRLEQR